ncbi:MAG: hypothetical protein D6786_01770 [Gammaproteobacteria bacterium]|nr:MAG: hypothetical protein D6786_01770 [Gammaproteobacteria bacterium]
MAEESGTRRRRAHWPLIALLLLFGLPYIGSWLLLQHPEWMPQGTVGHGELIVPARPWSLEGLEEVDGREFSPDWLRQGRWTLMAVAEGGCEQNCRSNLFHLRQIQRALGRDYARLQRLLLYSGEPQPALLEELRKDYPGMRVVILPAARKGQATGLLLPPGRVLKDRIYLLDPDGQVMMAYGPETPAKGILKDIQRLLKAR